MSRREVRCLALYPAPTYLVGIDKRQEEGYIVAILEGMTDSIPSLPTNFPLDAPNMRILWEEVRQFWQGRDMAISSARLMPGTMHFSPISSSTPRPPEPVFNLPRSVQHPMWRILGYLLFILWCLSWFPTLVGLLSEPATKPDPIVLPIRLICLANAAAYYVGGIVWLALRSQGRTAGKVAMAWALFVFLNCWGPVTLAICGAALGKPPRGKKNPLSSARDKAKERSEAIQLSGRTSLPRLGEDGGYFNPQSPA